MHAEIPEREEGQWEEEIFEKLRAENFPRLMAGGKPKIQEAQRTPNRTNTKMKKREPLEWSQRKKRLTYRGTRIRIMEDFLQKPFKQEKRNEIFKVFKEKENL